ncbi:MAG: helix-turn-helix transcriptional regulator [Fusicatenibacter sp.]|nr:helix-turn-helix transcriptional regulator [Lachnospiraceae bacterium]MDY2938097.1 helix-turn-helix transcriptional regulator [Fusicatenibacter sp.]
MREKQFFEYSREQEDRIITALAARNGSAATNMMNDLLRTNLLERQLSAEMTQCFLYCLSDTMMRAASEMGEFAVAQLDNMKGELENIHSQDRIAKQKEGGCTKEEVKRLQEQYARIAKKIVRKNPSLLLDRSCRLSQEILEYVSHNFRDPELNVSGIGQHFEMSANYLSTVFHKETGKKLVETIARMRVDEASRLLKKGENVNKAGEEAGFRDTTTFIRTFKKYMGKTPGQLKTECAA